MLYLFLKTVHIVAVVLFVGNIITGVLWKLHADRSGDPRLMAHALDGLIKADRWFTAPASVLILLSGGLLTWTGGYPFFGTLWIWMGLGLFAFAGVIFKLRVEPAQFRLREIAMRTSFDRPAYDAASRQWLLSGGLATLAPVIAIALMVFKPVTFG